MVMDHGASQARTAGPRELAGSGRATPEKAPIRRKRRVPSPYSYWFYLDTGVIASALSTVGYTAPDWLGRPHTALYAVALVDVWKGVGLATVIYIAGLASIPDHYYEAVAVDGGGAWRQFWNITLPLARPA